ncbi:hypothetical protein HUT06_06480 [Actinomadura sp. NAK00032]|uniref:hypothetical protein n=1 Tax=Actinomadura sp. NAK00032 TaxID=2742128 RepID=UPI0015912373|nr:hypothetical protein [Actinomadura sp. NAK00032]QKW33723.1 hypothetical protein HUT06_06480 [Actinomadura sp. NAK00032]
MSALLARLLDDAALFPPDPAPPAGALPAYRAAARAPVTGRLRCPASRFAELRAHLVPEDLLDLVLVADTGLEELPEALDAVRDEPRVRLPAVEITIPEDADQARSVAVAVARLPAGVPARVQVRPSTGWRDALDRIAAARDHGIPLGAATRTAPAAFIAACAERDLDFTCTAGTGREAVTLLLGAARAADAAGERDIARILDRTDAADLAAEARKLPDEAAQAARRLLAAVGVRHLGTALAELHRLGLIESPDTGEDMSP